MEYRRYEPGSIIMSLCKTLILSAAAYYLVPTASALEFPDSPFILPYDQIWEELENDPSPLLTVTTIGEDSVGNPMKAIKVSDNAAINEDEPAMLFTGVIHGREILGLRSVLELAERLTNDYETDARVRSIVDSFEIWIVPSMNPWGYQAPNGGQRQNGNGVDLNSNSSFRWESCYANNCLTPNAFKYRGTGPNSEPEITAMNKLIMDEKPIYGVTFHAGAGGQRGQILWTHLSYDKGPDGQRGQPGTTSYLDDVSVTAAPEHRHARWIAEHVLKPAIIDNSRVSGDVLCKPGNLPEACTGSTNNGSLHSSVSPHRNRTSWAYAATGMMDFLIETHGDLDGNGSYTRVEAFRENFFYEESPELDTAQQQRFDNAEEYSRNYADGMYALLDHALCPGSSGITGPGISGTVVDEFGQPLEATIRILEMETQKLAGFSHLHADYIDLDKDGVIDQPDFCTGFKTDDMAACDSYTADNPPENPMVGTDFMPRKTDKTHGRFYRMLPTVGPYALDSYTAEISYPGKQTYIHTVREPLSQSCAVDIGQISLSATAEPEPITDCSAEPRLSSPTAGSQLLDDEVVVDWESNGCHFWARAGTSPNTPIYLNKSLAGATSVLLTGLPRDGSDVHFRLMYRNTNLDGPWQSSDYIFKAPMDTNCESPPFIQSPQEGAILPEGSAELDIVSNGCVVWPYLGSRPRLTDYGTYPEIMDTHRTIEASGYPSDESDIFATLYYATEYDALVSNVVYQYKAPEDTLCTQAPALTSHTVGSNLQPGGDTISWTSNGCHYWLYVGDAPGRNQYHNQSLGSATSVSITGYPADGSDVHITLLYRNTNLGGPWQRKAFVLNSE